MNADSTEKITDDIASGNILPIDFLFYDNLNDESSSLSKEKRAQILSDSLSIEEKEDFIKELVIRLLNIDGVMDLLEYEGSYANLIHFKGSKLIVGFFHGRYLGVEELAALQKAVPMIEELLSEFLEEKWKKIIKNLIHPKEVISFKKLSQVHRIYSEKGFKWAIPESIFSAMVEEIRYSRQYGDVHYILHLPGLDQGFTVHDKFGFITTDGVGGYCGISAGHRDGWHIGTPIRALSCPLIGAMMVLECAQEYPSYAENIVGMEGLIVKTLAMAVNEKIKNGDKKFVKKISVYGNSAPNEATWNVIIKITGSSISIYFYRPTPFCTDGYKHEMDDLLIRLGWGTGMGLTSKEGLLPEEFADALSFAEAYAKVYEKKVRDPLADIPLTLQEFLNLVEEEKKNIREQYAWISDVSDIICLLLDNEFRFAIDN